MRLLPIILILLLISSCKAIREARDERKERKVEEWNLLHPEKSAQWCADHYPCTGDSTTVSDTLIADNYDYTLLIDSLLLEIEKRDSGWTRFVDSATTQTAEVYRKALVNCKKAKDASDAAFRKLQAQYKPCIPDTIKITKRVSTIDSAAVSALRLKAFRLEKENIDLRIDNEKWEGKAKERWWIALVEGILILGLVAVIIAILKGRKR
jgi:hypothetical protein